MSFHKKLKGILDKEKPNKTSRICNNFWCKARYEVNEDNLIENPDVYGQCKKCRSFSSDLSGGVTNNGERQYEGSRYDPNPQEVLYNQYVGEDIFSSKIKK